MEWTEKHDVILCQEILVSEPYKYKARILEIGKVWDEIDSTTSRIQSLKGIDSGAFPASAFKVQNKNENGEAGV